MKTKNRKRRVSVLAGVLLVIMGIALFLVKNRLEYIESDDILHEYFFLVPIGYLMIVSGLVISVVSCAKK